jgi:site-specific recombinase XerD
MNNYRRDFALDQRRRGLSEKTIEYRLRVLRGFADWLGKSPLEADDEDVQRFLDTCDVNLRSRCTYLAALAAFFRFARRQYGINDPTLDIVRPKLPRYLPRPIADADLEHAFAVAKPKMRAWLALMAFGGLRCLEVARLTREDVRDKADPPMLIVFGKGNKERAVPLNVHVERALRLHGMPRTGPLFFTRYGKQVSPETVSHEVARFFKNEGIGATAHQLRHWFATQVYASTRDLRLTQELLGHASTQTTSVYTSVDTITAAGIVRDLSLQSHHPWFKSLAGAAD